MVSSLAVVETQFTEQFRELLNGKNDDLRAFREDAFSFFEETGFPTPRNEEWKYTNVAPITKEDWRVVPVTLTGSPSTADDGGLFRRFNSQRNGFTALNAAFAAPVVYRIPKETVVDGPIEFSFATAEGTVIFPHVIVIAEAGSKATLIETYSSVEKGFTNAVVRIIVEDNANLTHFRVQKDSVEAFNVGTTEIMVGRGSYYNSTSINLGAALSRHDIDLKFTAEGGEALVDGLYMLNGSQHADTHSVIDHLVPHCTSAQNYKGVLNDRSRAVFNGKVFRSRECSRNGCAAVEQEPSFCRTSARRHKAAA
jgi:Fe-S cluster assembly protein SufD